MLKTRIILDTNILVSYLLKPNISISQIVNFALTSGRLLISQDTFDELRNVTERFVKRGFINVQESSEFLSLYVETCEWIKILETAQICRDPNDDKFLELALNGNAEYLITGDKDLRELNHFKNTKILTAKEFIAVFNKNSPLK